MAYDRAKIYEDALREAKENNVRNISELLSYLPIASPTFYEFFPAGSSESSTIKAIINQNKVKRKAKMLRNWEEKEASAALQIAAFKLIADDEEREILNNKQEQPVTHNITVEYGQEPPK